MLSCEQPLLASTTHRTINNKEKVSLIFLSQLYFCDSCRCWKPNNFVQIVCVIQILKIIK